MSKVLILGGAGFIGFHLARWLAESCEFRITLVDDFSRGQLDEELAELVDTRRAVDLVAGDLRSPDTFARLNGPFDVVFLLAGMVGVRNVEANPARVIHTNVSIVLHALEWLARVGCQRLLFASTSEAYAGSVRLGLAAIPTPEGVPLVVVDVKHPRSAYAVSKILGEAAVNHYARTCGFDAVTVRYHNVYGARMGFDHVIPELMQRIWQRMDPLPVYGLEQTRAFCHVTDAVSASNALMNCSLDGCEIVNVGNDQEEITIAALLEKLLALGNFHPAIEPRPPPAGAVQRRCPDISRLRTLTGFRPEVSIDDGLALTWEWYRQKFRLLESGPSSRVAIEGIA